MKKTLFLLISNFLFLSVLYSQQIVITDVTTRYGGVDRSSNPRIEFDQNIGSYPDDELDLCSKVKIVIQDTTTIPLTLGLDEMYVEIFKFKAGANPLDPSSTPPIRTISITKNLPECTFDGSNNPSCNLAGGTVNSIYSWTSPEICANWDGNYNVEGFWGKTNGIYGFRVTAKTNRVSPTAGNINIQVTSAYPGENQTPITVDVTNIHVVKTTPTVIGKITGIGVQPYNILYRLSKDALVTITVEKNGTPVRTIANNIPRFGEGIPDGALTNGDFWDGRWDNGLLARATNYLVRINAVSQDDYGVDSAKEYTFNMSLDPLQITDIAIKELGPSSTDVAVISYMLSEAATVYLDIYPPRTTFNDVNCYDRSINCGPSNPPIKSIIESKKARQTVSMYWDGRDSNGNYVCDGEYVFALSAETPGADDTGNPSVVWTKKISVGHIPVAKGNPLAFLNPSSTIIGSSPTAAGLNPFYLRYQLIRSATVQLDIEDINGSVVRNLVENQPRSSGLVNTETWDGRDNSGLWVSSGVYRARIVVKDPYACMSNNTFTHEVEFPVDLFRIVDVESVDILATSTNAAITYELSQPMWTEVKIYKPGTQIDPSNWPPNFTSNDIVYEISGMRPGRFKITEYWDGRDISGFLVEDGVYPFSIVAYSSDTQKMYAVDKAYGYLTVSRGQILFTNFQIIPTIADMKNSSEVIKLPPYLIEYAVTRQSSITVTVNDFNTNQVVARVITGETRDPFVTYQEYWDGKCYLPDSGACSEGDLLVGTYNINIYAQDVAANPNSTIVITTVTQTVDIYPLRIYDLAITPLTEEGPAVISYQVSEPMKVVIKIYKPDTRFTGEQPVCSGGEKNCLVNRIVGVRPARTLINDYWYGTDLTGASVPSGNYKFKIYASTNTSEIDSITGDCENSVCSALADDIIIADLPALQSYITDPCQYMEEQTYFAPNPFTSNTGNFRVGIPMIGNVEIRVYNIAGDLVYSYNSTQTSGWEEGISIPAEGGCISGSNTFKGGVLCEVDSKLNWNKTNMSGKKIAPGVYIAVFTFRATQGSKDLCQFRKKILIP